METNFIYKSMDIKPTEKSREPKFGCQKKTLCSYLRLFSPLKVWIMKPWGKSRRIFAFLTTISFMEVLRNESCNVSRYCDEH